MYETSRSVGNRAKNLTRVGLSAGALALSGLLTGCMTLAHPPDQARQDAESEYQNTWQQASPAGKYILQYLLATKIEEPYTEVLGGKDQNYSFLFNNGCLQNTAYNIAGDATKSYSSGVFSLASAPGSVPTAAAKARQANTNLDMLIVRSSHAGSPELHFEGIDGPGPLKPVDLQTQNVLQASNCQVGFMDAGIVDRQGDKSSAYVVAANADN